MSDQNPNPSNDSDPLGRHLDHFDPGAPMSPMTPAEIRQRGDRLRRRRTTMAVVGAAAAVAIIAAPLAVLANNTSADSPAPAGPPTTPPSETITEGTPTPDPAPDTEPSGLQEIPEDFPLAAELPETNGDGTPVEVTAQPDWQNIELCGTDVWSVEGSVDQAGVTYSGEAEDIRSRTLVLYANEDAAAAAFQQIKSGYIDCRRYEEGGTLQVYEPYPSPYDVNSNVLMHRYKMPGIGFDTGLEVLNFVQIGNAVLLTSNYSEAGATPASRMAAQSETHRSNFAVVYAMEMFDGDTSPPEPQPDETMPGSTDGALTSFPLTDGWPATSGEAEGGVEYPVAQVNDDFTPFACDSQRPAPEAQEVVRGTFRAPEDYRTRELYVFENADQAVGWVATLNSLYSTDCPEQSSEGFNYPVVFLPRELGGQSFGVVRLTEREGNLAIGLTALQVVRVGRSVFLDTISNEGGGGPGTKQAKAREALDRMAQDSGAVVAAQCEFTEAGC